MTARSSRRSLAAAVSTLRQALRSIAEVRPPEEADEPILAPTTRRAVFDWMAEINAAEELRAAGLQPRSSAMMFGPPGCGKTTLAHHLAARLGYPLVLVGSENIHAMYHGESERNAAKIFDSLTAAEVPCVLFLDEFDAIGTKRMEAMDGGTLARNSTLTVLLRKIEAYGGMLIAATNRREDIDPAIWRRFHLQMNVDLPGDDERFAIMKRYGAPFAWADEDLDVLVDLTAGASPALLRNMMEGVKRALILAPRQSRDISDPAAVFGSVIASLDPPEGMERPALWSGADALCGLRAFQAWPPTSPS